MQTDNLILFRASGVLTGFNHTMKTTSVSAVYSNGTNMLGKKRLAVGLFIHSITYRNLLGKPGGDLHGPVVQLDVTSCHELDHRGAVLQTIHKTDTFTDRKKTLTFTL